MSSVCFRPISHDSGDRIPPPMRVDLSRARERARSLSPKLNEESLNSWFLEETSRDAASLKEFVKIPEELELCWPSKFASNLRKLAAHLNLIEGGHRWNDRRSYEVMLEVIGKLDFPSKSLELEVCTHYCSTIENSLPCVQLAYGNLNLYGGKYRSQLASWIRVHLKDLEVSQNLFLPLGYEGHTIGAIILRSSEEHFSVIACDPARLKGSPYLTVSSIPEEQMIDPTLWDELLAALEQEESISDGECTLFRELDRLGKVEPDEIDEAPCPHEDACTIYSHLLYLYALCKAAGDVSAYDRIETKLKELVLANLENLNPGTVSFN